MNYLYPIVCSLIFSSCNENQKRHTEESQSNHNKVLCIEKCKGGTTKKISFNYEDFSSEGAEGEIIFKNDTMIEKIYFSFATSQKIVEQTYFFENNQLTNFEEITNYITFDKKSYSLSDTLKLTGKEFEKRNELKSLYNRLLKTALKLNPELARASCPCNKPTASLQTY